MKTYALRIRLKKQIDVQVGKLGFFSFPAGNYVYVGSAKRNIRARVARHKAKNKKLRWHIDYLLESPEASIVDVVYSDLDECALAKAIGGQITVRGFGSSDCRSGCGSHLKYPPD